MSNWKIVCPNGHQTDFVESYNHTSTTDWGRDGVEVEVTFHCSTCGSEIDYNNYSGKSEERTK